MEYKVIERPMIYAPEAVRIFGITWYAEAFYFRGQLEITSPSTAEIQPSGRIERKPAEAWRRLGYRVLEAIRA